jgi:hypothetical protein
MSQPDSTADYRKYPKGPNFTLIVALSAVTILIVLAAAVLFLHKDATKVDPHGPNPKPNSFYQPPAPRGSFPALAA